MPERDSPCRDSENGNDAIFRLGGDWYFLMIINISFRGRANDVAYHQVSNDRLSTSQGGLFLLILTHRNDQGRLIS